jgi:hypothetical protein
VTTGAAVLGFQANEDRHLCGTEFFRGLQLIERNIVPAADLLFDRPLNVGERELRIAIAGWREGPTEKLQPVFAACEPGLVETVDILVSMGSTPSA